jgi:type I restriction enzyme S subunit
MLSEEFNKRVQLLAQGTGIKNLSIEHVLGYTFRLPPITEQRRIAMILSTIQQCTASSRAKRASSQGVLLALLRRFFGPVGRLGESPSACFPEDWPISTVGEVCDVRRGASPRPKGDPKYFALDGPVPWIKISDLARFRRGKFLGQTAEGLTPEGKKKSFFVREGTLLLTNSGTVGIPVVLGMDGCIHDGYLAFLAPTLPRDFLYWYFHWARPAFIARAPKGTQANLNTGILKAFPVPLPPRTEMHRIVNALDTAQRALMAAEASVTAQERLFVSALAALLGGSR